MLVYEYINDSLPGVKHCLLKIVVFLNCGTWLCRQEGAWIIITSLRCICLHLQNDLIEICKGAISMFTYVKDRFLHQHKVQFMLVKV